MPRLTQAAYVSIKESERREGKRAWQVTIEASSTHFILTDELAKEGAVRDFESSLRSAIRDSVARYIASGREFVKIAAKKEKKEIEPK